VVCHYYGMGGSDNFNPTIEDIGKLPIAESNGLHDHLQNIVLCSQRLVVRPTEQVDVT
jgi:hypothetical protein